MMHEMSKIVQHAYHAYLINPILRNSNIKYNIESEIENFYMLKY